MTDIMILNFTDSDIHTGGDRDAVTYIPNPTPYKVSPSDIDNGTSRSESGYMTRIRVRQNVYSISCTWVRLSDSQKARLERAISPQEFNITFRETTENSEGVLTKYLSKLVYADANKEFEMVGTDSNGNSYWSFSSTFIEL